MTKVDLVKNYYDRMLKELPLTSGKKILFEMSLSFEKMYDLNITTGNAIYIEIVPRGGPLFVG